ncbi:MAG: DUF4163 domain-containing protein [Clostridiales bacterium]|nr:DUF4163 domain-containing protein [Clostridiales bacterium]
MEIMVEEQIKKELFTREGIELLEINIKYPSFSDEKEKPRTLKGIKKTNKFYEKITQHCFDYAKNKLLPHAETEYENNPNPRKRFTNRRYIYTLNYKLTHKAGNILSLIIDVALLHGGRRLRFKRIAHTFDLQSGRLCPLFLFADSDKRTKKALKEKEAGFYLRENKAVIFTNPAKDRKYREFSVPIRNKTQEKKKANK